jgi:putative ABC transport system permease protein
VTVLWLTSVGLTRAVRRWSPARWPYVWRQGLANLHRPANQTTTVVLALGFGAFLLATLYLVQNNLLRQLDLSGGKDRPNLVVLDIQPDQLAPAESLLKADQLTLTGPVPIVPMRIASLKGTPVGRILGDSTDPGGDGPSGAWALRREYRSTYRDTLVASERLVAGRWWTQEAGRPATGAAGGGSNGTPARSTGSGKPAAPALISVESEVAHELGVSVGDEIVWDVQGLELKSRVASLRRIRWARLEPNFFALFPEGPLADAPQSWVSLVRLDDAPERARLESRVVERLPNVSALDLADVQRTLDGILGRVAWAIRFMALFSGAVGACVLLGAVAASREQRLREAVLLKALGATRAQVRRIVLAEYACLGALASAAGVLLSLGAGWALLRFVFEAEMSAPLLPLAGFGLTVAALAAVLGGAASREVFRHTALELLRSE